jgi:glycosyltransferase involved in cell wall biosynthesis
LLVLTNNRFWRGSLGSQVRIASLCEHWSAIGWDVQVVFSGRCYREDASLIHAQGLNVGFSDVSAPPAVSASSDSNGASQPQRQSASPSITWRARLRSAWRWLRAAMTQVSRRRGNSTPWSFIWREIGLRAQEDRINDFIDPSAAALVASLSIERPPDVVLVEYVSLAWAEAALRPRLPPGTLWILDAHDVMHERQCRFHELGEVHGIDITASEESKWLSRFDLVLAIQPVDAQKFRAIGVRAPVITVMHPHPVASILVTEPANSMPQPCVTVGFVGSAMAPNRLALQELVQDIWPLVIGAVGGRARLLLAGSVCEVLIGDHLPQGVVAMGYVQDLDEFYRQVDVVVSPIRVGGGLKIKNVEALCKGKPLLTTPIGAEGLDAGAGSAFWIEDSAADLASALIRLVDSRALRDDLTLCALSFAERHFSKDMVYRELDEWLERGFAD